MSRPALLAAFALAALFAALVWPTPYHYHPFGATVARISRFTGAAEILTANGWHRMGK